MRLPRSFPGVTLLLLLLFVAASLPLRGACAQSPEPLPTCEWCGATEAPADVDWSTTIAGPEEPGEPLVITGTVYGPNGSTPAPGVILYVYHTNAEGIYPTRGTETGNGRRHGSLRSWVKTDGQGRYRVKTIRPGTYPTRSEPAHIHMTVKPPGVEEYWIDSLVFAGDPLITPENRGRLRVIEVLRDEDQTWRGTRDIVLDP
jgi:protocatechuate 3,4-dioxygenase beta subunit